jgi:hypothetical protein
MHYKNQREAHVGDPVVGKDWNGLPFAGVLVKTTPEATTCNGLVLQSSGGPPLQNVTIGELVHLDDAMAAPLAPPA